MDVHPGDFLLLYHHLLFKLMIGRERWRHHFLINRQLGLLNMSRVSSAAGYSANQRPQASPHPLVGLLLHIEAEPQAHSPVVPDQPSAELSATHLALLPFQDAVLAQPAGAPVVQPWGTVLWASK